MLNLNVDIGHLMIKFEAKDTSLKSKFADRV